MAFIVALSALAVFIPSTFAQSSGYPIASSSNITTTAVPYPLFNNTLLHGPTGTPISSGFTTSYVYASAIASSSIGSPASASDSAEGTCGQATVTETTYATVTVTATPSATQEEAGQITSQTSAANETSHHTLTNFATNYLTHTLISATVTGAYGNITSGAGVTVPTGLTLGKLRNHKRGRFAGH
ncbi:hypothetical protein MMC08_000696 [Hypocenomyce scalaris]|nr:hypothetical protein [Hypocenomyce scalaris]